MPITCNEAIIVNPRRYKDVSPACVQTILDSVELARSEKKRILQYEPSNCLENLGEARGVYPYTVHE